MFCFFAIARKGRCHRSELWGLWKTVQASGFGLWELWAAGPLSLRTVRTCVGSDSFALSGLALFSPATHGLRRGPYSFAALVAWTASFTLGARKLITQGSVGTAFAPSGPRMQFEEILGRNSVGMDLAVAGQPI